jgi:sugar phosphate isomerase/epimerase
MSGIALQLYTMREPAKADLSGMLKRVRDIGWEYVQWSGMPDLPAEAIREALDAAGLKAVAAHVGVESFERDFEAAVRFWKAVGVTDVAPGGMMADCRDSLDAWLRGAKRLDTLGARLRDAGLRLSYHNHNFEFERFEGDPRCKLDILYQETGPGNLYAEFDTAWVQVGGQDPAAYIRKYAQRCPVIHVKDLAPEARDGHAWFTPLGQGVLDWDNIFAASRQAAVEWYIYEQDTCDGDPIDSARISLDFLEHHA